MSEKEKRKHGEQKEAPFWLYSIFIFILLITAPFPLFHLLDAYPHVNEYQSFAFLTMRIIGIFLVCITVIWIFIEQSCKHKFILMFATFVLCYATLFHDGIGLMIIGVILSPVAIIFPIYGLGLVVMRFKRHIYTQEALSLVGMACIVAITIITINWYMSNPYHINNSLYLEDEDSYHLILDSGFLDPIRIKLYKCNSMGFFCEVIYTPDYNYYFDDNIYWEISDDDSTTITIFVNDETIHTEIISESY